MGLRPTDMSDHVKQLAQEAPDSVRAALRHKDACTPSLWGTRRERRLNALADLMIARHLRVSIPESGIRDRLAAAQHLPANQVEMVERDVRCIAVVGAGASFPLAKRADKLATKLETEFQRDTVEFERLQLVNNMKPGGFETRLIALSSNPNAARQVRATISNEYNIRHPTVLGYELLAHLLKHRFLDAIISFNFDELLDQSLDDELGENEYHRIVSERDCAKIETNADAANYMPLYIKLHGTASESDSLRFTPDSYYTVPKRIVEVTECLMTTQQCVILSAGSGLGSFDLQRLLGTPRELDVYNLSLKRIPDGVRKKIDKERRRAEGKQKSKRKTKGGKRLSRVAPRAWLHECTTGKHGCDNQLLKLTRILQQKASQTATSHPAGSSRPGRLEELVEFRSVLRHEVVASLLGADPVKTRKWTKKTEIDYLKRRTILELAFAGAKARGLMSLVPLASDRPARYYNDYRRHVSASGEDWQAFCSAAGLIEAKTIPDVMLSVPTLQAANDPAVESVSDGKETDETHMLHRFDCGELAAHVLARVKNPQGNKDLKRLTKTLEGLQDAFDVELHTQDDRVCSKVFKRPVTLRTMTSLKAYTWLMLDELEPDDEIYISSETGAWLLDPPISEKLQEQKHIRLLLAFNLKIKALNDIYGGVESLETACVNPWHHNRHMTILCKKDSPTRAIYFARHLRTPVITPVYLSSIRDVQHLKKTFDRRWEEAQTYQRADRLIKKDDEENAGKTASDPPT